MHERVQSQNKRPIRLRNSWVSDVAPRAAPSFRTRVSVHFTKGGLFWSWCLAPHPGEDGAGRRGRGSGSPAPRPQLTFLAEDLCGFVSCAKFQHWEGLPLVRAIQSVNALMSFESFVAPNQIEAFLHPGLKHPCSHFFSLKGFLPRVIITNHF